jgi:hypothetical protein
VKLEQNFSGKSGKVAVQIFLIPVPYIIISVINIGPMASTNISIQLKINVCLRY